MSATYLFNLYFILIPYKILININTLNNNIIIIIKIKY